MSWLSASRPYVGRFAPSPTGAMHLGITRTALVAWLDARAHDGQLLLRLEDIDGHRVVPGSDRDIVQDLLWLGLRWDGEPIYQSARSARYTEVLHQLAKLGRLYPCTCSRREIREASAPHGPGDDGPRYPGTCREGARERPGRTPAMRFRTEPGDGLTHLDRRLGSLSQDVHRAVGDFVVRRSDGLWAYQLAVAVDDLDQGITCVVRGEDLAASTARQLLLRQTIDPEAPPFETLHVPLMLGEDGRRLSKREGSFSLAEARAEGKGAKDVVGQLAWTLGLIEHPVPCSPEALIEPWRRMLEHG